MQTTSISSLASPPAPSGGPHPDPDSLFAVMREIGHGRVEDLAVRGGVPHANADTKFFRRHRPGRADPPARTRPRPGARLHPQHEKLLADCRLVQDGVFARVEIADGLPVFWEPPRPK